MPPPGPTEPTLQPVPSLEHGATLAFAVCRAALDQLTLGATADTTKASELTLKTFAVNRTIRLRSTVAARIE